MKNIFLINEEQEIQLFFDVFVLKHSMGTIMLALSIEEAIDIYTEDYSVDLVVMDPCGRPFYLEQSEAESR
ncbi:MAG: hypothetical protein A3I21_02020 [Candidatus Zambryskibacteria bacterium RIFCSPLOWO2_02_FULL_39_69]|uniref:Uncharacterized protein n=1 Tax=Candidatus Zambryskibacteria bacterium RIFCSPHIGHO2_02_38_10.5 TaxID=1802742 RepID=A0A1G2T674_9BACT|nr:MAG: hypothetical protein UT81_C0021G0005 [Parcubacteria group bacterium GW2011_GWA2_40_14]OHA92787.1 MAG: hypothetical protein A2W58_02515 [Candidatus Zambryskibacteria bacterium RIFCSPHIGHO2_02_38_10.5]OHB07527.1 MAG: hypothetical protein A2W64_00680 [Candidatus Zambryskibacteria bacterium RIFCSPLOWO2_02_39_10]OHB09644.1 MAG: hypothetical protein A3I21_02020 [Candidatus Zambryskibacteria bacterium RIFCSPLOWO2_02_FULL_39_69]